MRKIGRLLFLLALVPLIFWAVAAGNYYWYAAHGSTPYDEIGIGLAPFMPEPIRAWGCGRIRERFPNTLPPHGCQGR